MRDDDTTTAEHAPGWPGITPRWTSSAKSAVGTADGARGRVWFTLSHGVVNEVYYPRIDQACTRDLGFVVTAPGFFSEEKRHATHAISPLLDGLPAFHLVSADPRGRYRLEKDVLADPAREALLQRVTFTAPPGTRLTVLLAPHLGNEGAGNTAWVGDFKGTPMLFAQRDGVALALACSAGFTARSAGFVGASDGWQDLSRHGQLTWRYGRAENGNVALAGEVDVAACDGRFLLALGFGRTWGEAAHRAAASLFDGFERAVEATRLSWSWWQRALKPAPKLPDAAATLYRTSTTVLRTHESSRFPGGLIASLSIPWGFARGDGDLGGYHLVWPRDLVESAGGLLAAGATETATRVLRYLAVTQDADGRWPQNMWLDGTPYWTGVQLDEAGLPILLVDLARRLDALPKDALAALWPMVRRAAGFLVRTGPVTQQDRWEEDPGYSPFTLAVEVAALLAAADLADTFEPALSGYLRETADAWNAAIEKWTYVTGTPLARQVGVDGYYVRIAPPDVADAPTPKGGFVPIKNRPPGDDDAPAEQLVSPDALALVRFGLRAADDVRIVNTVRVIDALLKVDFPAGPLWRRYNGDGYGEHDDGRPFDGTGVGRPWPLLAGERAHYELAAGRREAAERLRDALPRFTGEGGLLPEQVWDGEDLPERELVHGGPSGSAMPLVWAHAEFVKLCRSLEDGRVFDLPPQPVQRYQQEQRGSSFTPWRFNHKCTRLEPGQRLRVEVPAAAVVHWSGDGWRTVQDTPTRDTGLGLHVADLATEQLGDGARIDFTFRWPAVGRWEGRDFAVDVVTGRGASK